MFDFVCLLFVLILVGLVTLQQKPLVSTFSFIFIVFLLAILLFTFGYYFLSVCILLLYIGAIAILFLFVILSLPENLHYQAPRLTIYTNQACLKFNHNGEPLLYDRRTILGIDVINILFIFFFMRGYMYYASVVVYAVQTDLILLIKWTNYFTYNKPYYNFLQTTITDITQIGLILYNTTGYYIFFIFSTILIFTALIGAGTVIIRLKEL